MAPDGIPLRGVNIVVDYLKLAREHYGLGDEALVPAERMFRRMGLSRRLGRELIQSGRLPFIQFGKFLYLTPAAVAEFLHQNEHRGIEQAATASAVAAGQGRKPKRVYRVGDRA